MLLAQHWWHGIAEDVRSVVASCTLCDRVKSSFNAKQSQLQPLPIEPFGYRWGVDLCGPFDTSSRGNTYVMVAIEHFSKFAVLVPIPDAKARSTSFAYMHHVLAHFGASAEVVTDQGGEFEAEFETLLRNCFIDHRTTSANHPQANGLAERAVQTLKRALKKHVEGSGSASEWDMIVPFIAMGYNASPQESTKLSPYQLVYARTPVVPPAIVERIQEVLDLDNTELAAADLLRRADYVKSHAVIATGNLKVAQHRDTLRYAQLRSGHHKARIWLFKPGDYVYTKWRNTNDTLMIKARPEILRVVEARPSGVLKLQGKCGTFLYVNASNCTPCHVPGIDGTIDPRLAEVPSSKACEICHRTSGESTMLFCDACNAGYHMACLSPPITQLPEGAWLCPECVAGGLDIREVEALMKHPASTPVTGAPVRTLFPTAKQRARVAGLRALSGRFVSKDFQHPVTGQTMPYAGKVEYREQVGPGDDEFLITYDDGDWETMSYRKLKPLLLPEGHVPEGRRVAQVARTRVGQVRLNDLPDVWDLSDREVLHGALDTLMPGQYTEAHVTRLSGCMPGARNALQQEGMPRPGEPECVPTLDREVAVLLRKINLQALGTVFDPWAGTGTVAKAVHSFGNNHVMSNDINRAHMVDMHADALQPGLYKQARQQGMRSIITSPWFRLLDIAVPLAALSVELVACIHVPGHFVYSAHSARMSWLKRMHAQGRLAILHGLDRGPTGRRCLWLLLFAHSNTKRMVLGPEMAEHTLLWA
jgi:hypothetical protein